MWHEWGENRNAHRVLVGIPEGKRRWENNNKLALQEIRWKVMEWANLTEDRDKWRTAVNAVMNAQVPQNAANFLTRRKTIRF
jgi:hypothetical protein